MSRLSARSMSIVAFRLLAISAAVSTTSITSAGEESVAVYQLEGGIDAKLYVISIESWVRSSIPLKDTNASHVSGMTYLNSTLYLAKGKRLFELKNDASNTVYEMAPLPGVNGIQGLCNDGHFLYAHCSTGNGSEILKIDPCDTPRAKHVLVGGTGGPWAMRTNTRQAGRLYACYIGAGSSYLALIEPPADDPKDVFLWKVPGIDKTRDVAVFPAEDETGNGLTWATKGLLLLQNGKLLPADFTALKLGQTIQLDHSPNSIAAYSNYVLTKTETNSSIVIRRYDRKTIEAAGQPDKSEEIEVPNSNQCFMTVIPATWHLKAAD